MGNDRSGYSKYGNTNAYEENQHNLHGNQDQAIQEHCAGHNMAVQARLGVQTQNKNKNKNKKSPHHYAVQARLGVGHREEVTCKHFM